MKEENQTNSFIYRLCSVIVDKRSIVFLFFIVIMLFSAVTKDWVNVENSMAFYLPQSTETKRGLDLMDEQFITYGSCKAMIANVSYEQGEIIKEDIEAIDGVFSVEYENEDDFYAGGSALLNITFEYDEDDDTCLELLETVKEELSVYDSYISTSLGDQQSELIKEEMNVISVFVAIIVLVVLFITCEAYAEIPVLILTFCSAAAIQMGTNYVFGTISFVSNSVTVVLQLALSVDYAVIFINRYKEEHELLPPREATIVALSKAIPEISGSSLTTIGGLIAMTFMQYQMGPDLGIVLIKSIIISLLAVFLLMPGLIMLFADLMDKTRHKSFVPKIPFVGKFAYATKFFIAPLFLVAIVVGYFISSACPYVFGYSNITPPIKNRVQIVKDMQEEVFAPENMVALVVPSVDYDLEKKLAYDLEKRKEVDKVVALSNTEAMGDYTVTDKLTPRQFAELLNLDYEVAELVYTAYAVDDEDYGKVVNGLSTYKVPLIDMLMFVYDEVEDGYVTLDVETKKTLDDAHKQMNFGKEQLKSDEYSRMLVYLTLPEESKETFDFIDEMHDMAGKYFEEKDKIFVVGESVSQYDLQKTFGRDNMVVNVVSILAVLAVLLFTFKSSGMPILLIAVIQGSIWINFSVPTIMHSNIFFMSYLIVSSIQMGANIDYAIVIASRYTELRLSMGRKQAIIDTLNFAFPTIVTSGTMLATAGILIGMRTSDGAIYNIGQCLGRGTIISIGITMFVLPQILLVGDYIIEKTAFVVNAPIRKKSVSGFMRVNGLVRGKIDGVVTGSVNAIVRGNVSAFVDAGTITPIDKDELRNEMMSVIESTIIDSEATNNESDSVAANEGVDDGKPKFYREDEKKPFWEHDKKEDNEEVEESNDEK